jgi:hypothetical protein
MPARVLAGLLPSALLDQYNFWQQAGGDLIGESKSDDVADTEIHVRMVPRAKVSCTGGEGVCARIVRRRKRREALPNEKADASPRAAAPTSVGDDDEPELMLLNLIYAPIDTPLFSVARQLARIEDLSHVLVWTPALPYDELLERPTTRRASAPSRRRWTRARSRRRLCRRAVRCRSAAPPRRRRCARATSVCWRVASSCRVSRSRFRRAPTSTASRGSTRSTTRACSCHSRRARTSASCCAASRTAFCCRTTTASCTCWCRTCRRRVRRSATRRSRPSWCCAARRSRRASAGRRTRRRPTFCTRSTSRTASWWRRRCRRRSIC